MRKYFPVALLLLLCSIITKAQMPQLTIDGKTNNGVQLQALKIDVKVCGTVARTTWQMTFKNTTSKILEGTLNFPLKDGLSASRYALDINGKMREAVPVDRAKGTEVFETIERRRVDPGLLEKADGNTFRTRIYPINPNSTRTVLIGYEEELPLAGDAALHYYLPLNLKDTVADFNLDLSVIQSATQPVFDSSLNENISFTNSNNQYNAAMHKINYVPGYALSFSIPKPLDAAEVMLQEFENKYYYLINTRLQKNEREKTAPSAVGLLWDVSLSGTGRNIKKEMELLDAYFKKLNSATIDFIAFSNTIKNTKTYTLANGNWEELKKDITALQYDGATDLGNLNLKNIKADEFLLVSDGHHTLGNKTLQLGNKPVYCINSSVTADYSNLKFIAGKTGGLVIDIQHEAIADALKKLVNQPFRFLGIKQNNFTKENYPSIPVVVADNFAVAGIADEAIQEMVLQFGYGNNVTYEKTITINSDKQLCENFDITKVFAQKKIAELDIQYNQNKQEIERLGKQFGVVTRNTSLIVLETINDYLQYQIEPPAELRQEYDRIMKMRGGDIITKKEADLRNSLNMMAVLKGWYDKKEVVTTPAQNNPVAIQRPVGITPRPVGETKTLSGKITDKDGNAVAGSTVMLKGTHTGVSSDANGGFSIRAKKGDVLQFSAVGFIPFEQRISNSSMISVVIEKSRIELQEVVVIGYGSEKRTMVTGSSVQNISSEQLNVVRQNNINDALAGKVAGVQVRSQSATTPGASNNVGLRGQNGLDANSGLVNFGDGEILKDRAPLNPDDDSRFQATWKDKNNANSKPTGRKNTTDGYYQSATLPIDSLNPSFNPANFDYLKAIKQTDRANRYLKYLELRKYYSNRPTYFFDIASYLLKTGDKINGITILTNLAELENGSYELYKMLGYKLKEAGDYENELSAFKKVMELRPSDPQSFRDCALAYLDLGYYQQALDMLYEGMTKSYSSEMNRMYNGIEEIFLTEINRIIALHKKELDLKKIDKNIIAAMPTDVRVVMNWNKNNSDIDLWVTDPNGEKCFYSHKLTEMGGRISDDFTEGFGPEQFMLKTGVKGKYKIQINYYSDRQVTIAGPTTVMAEIYLHYGAANEEKKIITLQMEKDKQGEVFIGEVEL
ncbi:VIT domain-containing protein [Ferruginibacter profundus]